MGGLTLFPSHWRPLRFWLPWQNPTSILLSAVCLDVQSASSSFPKFLRPRKRHRPPNYQLPQAVAKKSWELWRKSSSEFHRRLGIESAKLMSRAWLPLCSSERQSTNLAAGQPQVTPASSLMATVARGGWQHLEWKQSKNCEDNIWGGNNWTIKGINTSAPILTNLVFVGKGTILVWFVFVYLWLPE